MDGDAAELEVQLAIEGDAPAEELDQLTLALRQELLELDVDAVDRPRAEAPPPGARAAEVLGLGGLVITLAPQLLGTVLATLRSWLSRDGGRSAKLQLGDDVLELSNATPDQQDQMIAAFLARHADG
ncbi:MAG TPA: hypothetical protein VF545_00145 [Thermoleophilaceae bacterium]|jgi:hypothetical protein